MSAKNELHVRLPDGLKAKLQAKADKLSSASGMSVTLSQYVVSLLRRAVK
jgi:hypothetical protein